MPSAEFEPATPATKRPQAYVLYRAAAEVGLRTTNHAKQAALSRQASMHRVHKRRFGVRQWTGVSEHISSWPV